MIFPKYQQPVLNIILFSKKGHVLFSALNSFTSWTEDILKKN